MRRLGFGLWLTQDPAHLPPGANPGGGGPFLHGTLLDAVALGVDGARDPRTYLPGQSGGWGAHMPRTLRTSGALPLGVDGARDLPPSDELGGPHAGNVAVAFGVIRPRTRAPLSPQSRAGGGWGPHGCTTSMAQRWINDPSAGSPTDTLLRLLLPLDRRVRITSCPRPWLVIATV